MLEHIQDEKSALGELYRSVETGWVGYYPGSMDLSLEKTNEDSSAIHPKNGSLCSVRLIMCVCMEKISK